MKKTFATFGILSILLTGCSHMEQTTSGTEYLSQYKYVPVAPSTQITAPDGSKTEVKSIDQRVREAAAIEPILNFPARIGLARIDGGAVTLIPAEEVDGWNKTAEKLGKSFGEFVTVNPMVARMAADGSPSHYGDRVNGVIDVIRLGAARQHLDAVLVYEVVSKENTSTNIFAAANPTILGAYIMPSERHDAEGLGNALLIDVIQGYPYGTLTTVVSKKSRMSSSWGWGSGNSDKEEFAEKIKAQAAKQLSDEAYDMFIDLRKKLAERPAHK